LLRLLQQISFRQLRASWGRTALVVGGIATGVSLIVAIQVVNTSVLESFRQTIELMAGPSDLEVTLGVGEIGFPEATIDTVRADPDVAAAVPLIRGTISLAEDPRTTLQLFGADLMAEEDLQRYQITAVTDRRELLRVMEDPRSILLTKVFASQQGVAVGDSIRLSMPGGVEDITVRGLLEAGGLAAAFGGQLAVMDLPAAQLRIGKQGRVDQIDVVLRRGADLATVARRLRAVLPSMLNVGPPAHRVAEYERILGSFQAMLTGISTLCLVAGIFIVYNTTSTGAAHRAMAMARLRVIGAAAGRVFQLLILEALILGTVGTAVGMVVGMGLAWLLSGMVTESMGIIFQRRFPVERLAVDLPQLCVIASVGIGAGLFASYFAARRVASLEPLDVLRTGAGSDGLQIRSHNLMLWWLVLIGISAGALVAQERLKSVAWGNFGATLWNGSVIVVAVPIVSWLSGAIARILRRLFGAEGQMAVESLSRSATRTGVTAAAIALVLTLAIIVSSLTLSFRRSMNDYVGRVLAGDLVVSAVATEGGWLETPLPERLATELLEVPGVRSVETVRVLPGQIYRGMRISIGGLSDGFFDPSRYPTYWYREGNPEEAAEAIRAGKAVNISTGLADRADLHVGDRIELDTPTGPLALPIVGVVPDYISDRGAVILSRQVLVDRWREPTVSRINLTLEGDASVDVVRARIADRYRGQYLLKALSLHEVLAYHDVMINRAFAFTDAIQVLVIIVAVAGIFDLLASAIIERRRELALWRVIGADERAVRRSVVIESATIGALGSLLGVVVGLVTAWIWIRFNFRYLLGYYLEQHFALGSTLWYIGLVMMMTILAGYAAAYRATRESVIDAIQVQ